MKYKPESDIGESDQRLQVGLCRNLDVARGLRWASVHSGYSETDKTGNMIGYEGYAKERLSILESTEAKGDTIVIQDFKFFFA